jgi:hypothetical protein
MLGLRLVKEDLGGRSEDSFALSSILQLEVEECSRNGGNYTKLAVSLPSPESFSKLSSVVSDGLDDVSS